ncbi:MAG: TauD/TfdA family dioxygenase, partial [Actinomycetota bacterium]
MALTDTENLRAATPRAATLPAATPHAATLPAATPHAATPTRVVRIGNRGGVIVESAGHTIELPAPWWRDQSTESGQIEPTNLQRLFTPLDVPADLTVTSLDVQTPSGDDTPVSIGLTFSDGHTAHFDLDALERTLGWMHDDEEPPGPVPWTSPLDPFPHVAWDRVGWSRSEQDPASVVEALGAFFRHGYVVFRGVPTEPGTIRRVAARLGYLVATNFGEVFDVRTEARPTDLAFTSHELLAHCDLPYRTPAPGIQLLHCLANDADGGDSTLVDGLAASRWLAEVDPDA